MEFGILEFGLVPSEIEEFNFLSEFESFVNYCVELDDLGTDCLWLAEIYSKTGGLLWSNPEIIMPILAGCTSNIKIGVAGVLLPYHNVFRIWNNFKFLNSVYYNRIRMGLTKGMVYDDDILGYISPSGVDDITYDFIKKLDLIKTYNSEDFSNFPAPFYGGLDPELFYLSSSERNLSIPLNFKVNLVRSIFHKGSDANIDFDKLAQVKLEYKEKYNISLKVFLSFAGSCSDDKLLIKKVLDIRNNNGVVPNVVGDISAFDIFFNKFKFFDGFIYHDLSPTYLEKIESIKKILNLLRKYV